MCLPPQHQDGAAQNRDVYVSFRVKAQVWEVDVGRGTLVVGRWLLKLVVNVGRGSA